MQENPYQDPLATKTPSRLTRLSVITGAGLLATLLAAGLGGVASAQTVIDDGSARAEPTVRVVQERAVQLGDEAENGFFGSSPEDEAVWQRFDQCLTDAGINLETDVDADDGAPDEATIDAAFEQCDRILDDLSEDAFGDFEDLSAEDEAVFDEYDGCLTDAGVDDLFEDSESEGAESDGAEFDEVAVDALFEQCDPILDGLSEQAQGIFGDFEVFGDFDGFGDLSAEDEAVFDEYDGCLTDAGVDDLFEGAESDGAEFDEAVVDALFEQCDPILDGLSEHAQELFGDCPNDDEHNEAELEDADA